VKKKILILSAVLLAVMLLSTNSVFACTTSYGFGYGSYGFGYGFGSFYQPAFYTPVYTAPTYKAPTYSYPCYGWGFGYNCYGNTCTQTTTEEPATGVDDAVQS